MRLLFRVRNCSAGLSEDKKRCKMIIDERIVCVRVVQGKMGCIHW